MAQNKSRGLMKILFQNFVNSFKIRQIKGDFKGEDYFGNKYYEIPASAARGKAKTSRWFEPPEKENHEQEVTAEWEAWLRGRRKEPPTDEELLKNLAIIKLKQKNAAKLDKIYGKPGDSAELEKQLKGKSSFPAYSEYEVMPGKSPNEK